MVYALATDVHDPNAVGDECLRANLAARRADLHPIEIPNALLLGERAAHLDEQLGHELGEPREPATHCASEVMLREAVRGDDVRIPLVAHACHLVVVLGLRPVFVDGTRLLLGIEQVLHGRLDRLVVRRQRAIDQT
jgi:hypothetical protein